MTPAAKANRMDRITADDGHGKGKQDGQDSGG
jgi:hypothetical protein